MPSNYTYQDLKDNLDYMKITKGLIQNAIVNKGQNISNIDTFRSYVNKINNIQYGTPTLDADATNSDVLAGKFGYARNVKVDGSITNLGALNYNPSTNVQNIPAGYTTGGVLNAVTSAIDSNIQVDNIKKDVTILNVTGNWDGDHSEYLPIINALTAEVNKYKSEGKSSSATGNPIIVNDSTDLLLKDIKPKGKTEQYTTTGKNLLQNNIISQTINGLNIVVNTNGEVIINGTASDMTRLTLNTRIKLSDLGISLNDKIALSGCPSGGGTGLPISPYGLWFSGQGTSNIYDGGQGVIVTVTQAMLDGYYIANIDIASGIVCNNLTFKPMLEKSSTITEYEPYTRGIPSPNPAYPQEIVNVENKNLINIPSTFIITGYREILDLTDTLELNKEYIVSCDSVIKGGASNPVLVIKHGSSYISIPLINNTVSRFTCTDTVSHIYVYSNGWDAAGSSGVTSIINNLMISKNGGYYTPYNLTFNINNKNLFIDDFDKYIQPHDYRLYNINLEKNKTYTISATLVGDSMTNVVVAIVPYGIRYSDFVDVLNAGTCINASGYTSTKTITVNSTWTAPKLVVYATNRAVFNDIFTNYNVQLEEGSTATDYVSHQEQTATFRLEEGQKLYEGSYLADDGIHHIRKQIVLDGTETYINKNITDNNILFSTYKIDNSFNTNKLDCQSNYFKNDNNLWTSDVEGIHIFNMSASLRMRINKSLLSDISTVEKAVASFKNWLSEYKPIVEYELAEEEVISYTKQQKEDWENIKRLKTYNPYTKIEYISNLNADMDIEYFLNN